MNKVIANSSLAHTVGNVTSLMTEFIKQRFPDNYFRHTHINSRMAYREQKKEENSKQEFIKKVKPILVVRPRMDFNNSDIFLYNSFLTTNVFGQRYTGQTTNMMPLYLDRNIKLGNIISDGYMIIRYKKNNTIIKRGILIEVQLHGRLSDCVDKYTDVESIKEYVINQGMQTLPLLLVISDLTGKIRNKILKVINIDCSLDCVSECIL